MCDFYMDKPTNDHQLTPFYIASERIWLSGFFLSCSPKQMHQKNRELKM